MKVFGGCFFLLSFGPFGFTEMIVFNRKSCDFLQLLDIIKVRLAHWCHGKWPSILASVNDFILNPASISANDILPTPSRSATWICPPLGLMRLNVDGSAMGKPGAAALGGVLCDHVGAFKGVFSKSIGIEDSNFVEFMAIKEGLSLFSSSTWAQSHNLIIESDSKNAILWAKSHLLVPWRMKLISNQIEALKFRVKGVSFVHIFREANSVADSLAKAGISRSSDLVAWL